MEDKLIQKLLDDIAATYDLDLTYVKIKLVPSQEPALRMATIDICYLSQHQHTKVLFDVEELLHSIDAIKKRIDYCLKRINYDDFVELWIDPA